MRNPVPWFVIVAASIAHAQQPLGDLNPFTTDPDSSPGRFAPFASGVAFAATSASTGRELWGLTLAGATQLLADLSPASSNPEHLTWVGNRLFFIADDGAGRGLWVLEPLMATVRKLRVLSVRAEPVLPGVSYVAQLFALGSQLLLIADDGVTGPELWRSDGTVAGTQLVRELEAGSAGGFLQGATVLGNELFFAVRTPHAAPTRTLLVRTDGTAAGTVVVARSDQGGPEIRGTLVTAGAQVFFAGWAGTASDLELWATDGTAAGTRLVVDWNPSGGSFLGNLIAVGNRVAYVALVPANGDEPVISDGTAAGSHVIDIRPLGTYGSIPNYLTAMGGDVYLFAVGFPGSGLYRIDVATRTATIVAPLRWTVGSSPFIVAAGSRLFFRALADSAASRTAAQLWVSDGTPAGTTPLRDLRAGLGDPRFDHLTAVGSDVVFTADDGLVGREPWRSDGTPAGTTVAANVHTSPSTQGVGSAPTFFLPARHATLLDADDGLRGRELWRTDGTAAGTLPLPEFVPGVEGARLVALGVARGEALFTAVGPPGVPGAGYYASDGTAAGTRRLPTSLVYGAPVASTIAADRDRAVVAFAPRLDGFGFTPQDWALLRVANDSVTYVGGLQLNALPRDLVLVGNAIFYAATMPLTGYELWTWGGLQPVLDIRPGPAGSDPGASLRIALGNVLLFSADDGVSGVELWRSDGTAAGTRLLRDLSPGAASGNPRAPVVFGDRVLFVADTPGTGEELWATDGTPGGTALLHDLWPGAAGSAPRHLVATPTRVFFAADDGVAGREPFVLDGSGVRRVADVHPGPSSSNPRDLVALGSRRLLFVADDGSEGEEPWVSDGTTAGTTRVVLRPGPAGSGGRAFTVRNDGRVLFAASDGVHGDEPWSLDAGAVAQRVAPGCGVAETLMRAEDPVLGSAMRVDVWRAGGGNLGGVLFLGLPRWDRFLDCTIYADLGGIALPFAFVSGWSATLPVPDEPSLRDVDLRAQALLAPFAAPPGWSLSDAWALQPGR